MLSWALRILLLLLVLRLLLRFVKGLLDGFGEGRIGVGGGRGQRTPGRAGGRAAAVALVKDPVCGTYLPRDRALTSPGADGTEYFCSEACRDEYARGARR